VFVRAVDDTGRWGTSDVLDLDDESFRVFVAGMLMRAGIACGLADDYVEGAHIALRLRPGLLHADREREDRESVSPEGEEHTP
jgi:hypothetical protein